MRWAAASPLQTEVRCAKLPPNCPPRTIVFPVLCLALSTVRNSACALRRSPKHDYHRQTHSTASFHSRGRCGHRVACARCADADGVQPGGKGGGAESSALADVIFLCAK